MTLYDPGPWDDTGAIDRRHAMWMAETLASGQFPRVLEVGCLNGYSTRAFMFALRCGWIKELHLCDPELTPGLLKQISGDHPGLVFHLEKSIDLLARAAARDAAFDLVCIDGDHSRANMAEETRLLLDAEVGAVFAHDTNIVGLWGPGRDDGPALLKSRFISAGYFWLEDCLKRPGEWTERGMFFAARTPELFDAGVLAAEAVHLRWKK